MTRDNIVGTLHGNDHIQGGLSVGGGVSSYNELEDLPTLNGETIIGNMSIWQPKNFSNTEQNTGLKWIDGKDIYYKTVDIAQYPVNLRNDAWNPIFTIDNSDYLVHVILHGMCPNGAQTVRFMIITSVINGASLVNQYLPDFGHYNATFFYTKN